MGKTSVKVPFTYVKETPKDGFGSFSWGVGTAIAKLARVAAVAMWRRCMVEI